jgi:hypothetical protein
VGVDREQISPQDTATATEIPSHACPITATTCFDIGTLTYSFTDSWAAQVGGIAAASWSETAPPGKLLMAPGYNPTLTSATYPGAADLSKFHANVPSDPTHPYAYSYTVKPPAGGSGYVGILQLITRTAMSGSCTSWQTTSAIDLATPSQTTPYYGAIGTESVLENQDHIISRNDDPGQEIRPWRGPFSDDLTLDTFLVYAPTGGIPVELAHLRFRYKATSIYGQPGEGWFWDPATVILPVVSSQPLDGVPVVTYSTQSTNHGNPCPKGDKINKPAGLPDKAQFDWNDSLKPGPLPGGR